MLKMCYANNAIGISNHIESVKQNTFFRFISFKFNIVRIYRSDYYNNINNI